MGKIKNNKCPFCGESEGYYVRTKFKGMCDFRYRFDGTVHENSDIHDNIQYFEFKTKYCISCHKKIKEV